VAVTVDESGPVDELHIADDAAAHPDEPDQQWVDSPPERVCRVTDQVPDRKTSASMTQPLTYRLDYRFPIAVVRMSGALTPQTAAVARSAVLESLVEEPTSVIVDLAGLTDVDDLALQVFPGAAAQAAGWPGAAVLLCAPQAAVADALERSSVRGELPVHEAFGDALAVAAADPVPQRMKERLAPSVHAPRAARELVAEACHDWGLPETAIAAEVIASELVTNAVRHAGTAMELRVTLRDQQLRVSVRDGVESLARMQTPTESDDHGRGLLIVDSIASAWGNVPVGEGKVVWASVRVPPDRRSRLSQVDTES
jgi:anti-anti-sigma regulatory factor/anti-sigma regulatory factor (Ser/Thr protein kinase)